jgi:putative N-acetylmannosamine-6-phosphate epimerase
MIEGQPERWLTCSCCGDRAGRFHQWPNRDAGYGICRKCIEWFLRDERMTAEQIKDCYGIDGINYAAKGHGLTLADYTTAVNKENQAHHDFMREFQPQLYKTMSETRTYTDEQTRTYWDRGYWPEQAGSALESDNVTPEHLTALGFPASSK